jgi:hypothetical protein
VSQRNALTEESEHTGDMGKHTWPTVKWLLDNEYLTCNYSKRIDVTPKGKAWCMEHHMDLEYR